MTWAALVAFALWLIKAILGWLGIGQTREQDVLEDRADEAAEKKREALDAHPPDVIAASLWDKELRRLHEEIAAKRDHD